ncbi:MAG: group II intron reverse transcriptase/maturase [Planctomycetaceae bacterium]|nr:MAG: group II intron reverse transcriptase/maturase [Planctomycetaceae bacterium]
MGKAAVTESIGLNRVSPPSDPASVIPPGYWRWHVCKEFVLAHAYALCKANRGEPGVDGQRFGDIEACGLGAWLGELASELSSRTYRPSAVRRVYIPKPGNPSQQRPLGIPTIRDRVVQTAAVLVLSPIFEADLQPEQYAYREGVSALDAVRHVHTLLNRGFTQVVDADLSGYFDSIPQAELMTSLARRIVDGAMLHLIKMWLEMPVEETDDRGRRHRTTRNKDESRGTPQGAPISPLLSNLYMRRFVLGWKVLGHARRLNAYIVNYADDFVICCRGTAQQAATTMRSMMSKLKLTVNETKTQVREVPAETFDFLGYQFGLCWSYKRRRMQLGTRPSKKRVQRICQTISEETATRWKFRDTAEQIGLMNRMLRGWANYFCLGSVSRSYRAVERHARKRLRQWLSDKHKRQSSGWAAYTDGYLHDQLGLVRLSNLSKSVAWAKA